MLGATAFCLALFCGAGAVAADICKYSPSTADVMVNDLEATPEKCKWMSKQEWYESKKMVEEIYKLRSTSFKQKRYIKVDGVTKLDPNHVYIEDKELYNNYHGFSFTSNWDKYHEFRIFLDKCGVKYDPYVVKDITGVTTEEKYIKRGHYKTGRKQYDETYPPDSSNYLYLVNNYYMLYIKTKYNDIQKWDGTYYWFDIRKEYDGFCTGLLTSECQRQSKWFSDRFYWKFNSVDSAARYIARKCMGLDNLKIIVEIKFDSLAHYDAGKKILHPKEVWQYL